MSAEASEENASCTTNNKACRVRCIFPPFFTSLSDLSRRPEPRQSAGGTCAPASVGKHGEMALNRCSIVSNPGRPLHSSDS
jgi:hypothetical protein